MKMASTVVVTLIMVLLAVCVDTGTSATTIQTETDITTESMTGIPSTNATTVVEVPSTTNATTESPSTSTEVPSTTNATTQSPSTSTEVPSTTNVTTTPTTGSTSPSTTATQSNRTANTSTVAHTSTPPITTTTGSTSFLYINEVKLDTVDNTQFIELKGSINATDLTHYAVVLMNSMSGKQTKRSVLLLGKISVKSSNGFYLINITQDIVTEVLNATGNSTGAVVALYNRKFWVNSQVPKNLTVQGLVDAVVFGPQRNSVSDSVLNTFTPNVPAFIIDQRLFKDTTSINRCFGGKSVKDSSVYAAGSPSPLSENSCPQRNFKKTVQFKLTTAKCRDFKVNSPKTKVVIDIIVQKVSSACHCGLTRHYFTDIKIFCGSVIFQATLLASSQDQADKLQKSYQDFVRQTPSVKVDGISYSVDTTCYHNCYAPPSSGLDDVTITVAVVVSCLCVFLIIVAVVVIYIRRKRRGILQFRMTRLDDDDDKLIGSEDQFVGGDDATFFGWRE